MTGAKLVLDRSAAIGTIDDRVYGSFVEHLGRAVYTGIYEPGHAKADADGFRTDVLELVRELRVPIVRYPGGNFVSGYDWEDGVGPREKRPRRLELAWGTIETNQVGTNEFVAWCRKAGTEPLLAVNLGSRGLDAARRLVEYCNHPGGTALSDLRAAHGWREPHRVKTWCLGNEMDGPWQIGHKTAEEYGRAACETAKAMKWADPSIELVACGSSGPGMPTFPAWDKTILEDTYDHVEYVSLHTYLGKQGDDTASFLAASLGMERQIEAIVRVADQVRDAKKSKKTLHLSFDEWNVWYHSHENDRKIERWRIAPPQVEDTYTMEDALVVGCMLIALLKHADRVRIACLAQLVNVIAPIMTAPGGPAWRQTIFWPFLHASRHGRGTALRAAVECPRYPTKAHGDVPVVEAVGTVDDATKAGALFLVNRSADPVPLEADLRGLPGFRPAEHLVLAHPDLMTVNDATGPDRVVPRTEPLSSPTNGVLRATLAPRSWNVVRLSAGKLD